MSSITTPQAPFIAASEFYLVPNNAPPNDTSIGLVPAPILTKLRTVSLPRIKDMRTAGISMQVLSHVPVYANLTSCVKINNALNAVLCTSPDRFAAMALLPVVDGGDAALELRRCVTKYGFVGGVLPLRNGVRIDEGGFEELWTVAEKYQVPVAVRESWPCLEQTREIGGNYPDSLLGPLLANFYTAHGSSPIPLVQLYAAGVFDRHPNLRLITSRSGLTMASLLPRAAALSDTLRAAKKPSRSFLDVWQHNFYVTTEDVLDMASMKALLEQIPVDRVLYGANYPFEDKGRALMAELKESGVVGKEEWERIASKNAVALFGLGKATQAGRALYLA